MATTGEVCIPCLQTGLSDRDYGQILKDYLEYMDEDIKTPNYIYQERLSACSQCGFLRNGICRLRSCFVALRVARTHNHCADTPVKRQGRNIGTDQEYPVGMTTIMVIMPVGYLFTPSQRELPVVRWDRR